MNGPVVVVELELVEEVVLTVDAVDDVVEVEEVVDVVDEVDEVLLAVEEVVEVVEVLVDVVVVVEVVELEVVTKSKNSIVRGGMVRPVPAHWNSRLPMSSSALKSRSIASPEE